MIAKGKEGKRGGRGEKKGFRRESEAGYFGRVGARRVFFSSLFPFANSSSCSRRRESLCSLPLSLSSHLSCSLESLASLSALEQSVQLLSPRVESERESVCSPRRKFAASKKKKLSNGSHGRPRRAQRRRHALHDDQADADAEGKRSFRGANGREQRKKRAARHGLFLPSSSQRG